jgi:signal transduction histidine kinase
MKRSLESVHFRVVSGLLLLLALLSAVAFAGYVRHCYLRESVILIGALTEDGTEVPYAISSALSPNMAEHCYQAGLTVLQNAGYQGTYGHLLLRSYDTALIFWAAVLLLIAFGLCLLWRAKNRQEAKDLRQTLDYIYAPDLEAPTQGLSEALTTAIGTLKQRLSGQQQLHQEDTTRVLHYMEDISHQLKTPLAVIRAACERTAMVHQETSAQMDTAMGQVDKMTRMIRDLIQLGRFDCGRQTMRFGEIPAHVLIETTVNELDDLAQEKSLKVLTEGPDNILWYCDAFWLQEALGNLLKNCIEHSAQGEIHISFRQSERLNHITISDSGEGFERDYADRIFERYCLSGRTGAEGAGIGMSIAAQVIGLHLGTITARNRENGGAEFQITFPRLDAETIYSSQEKISDMSRSCKMQAV